MASTQLLCAHSEL